MVFYECLNLTANGLFQAKTSVYLESSLNCLVCTCLGNASFVFCGVRDDWVQNRNFFGAYFLISCV